MLKFLARRAAPFVLRKALRLQGSIGYGLVFKKLPEAWLSGYVLVDMTKTWRRYGLPIRGVNFFTLGAVKDGVSSRFLPGDAMYQAWLGGYVFTADGPVRWTPQQYLKLAEADQKKWLWYYGVTDPKMDFGNIKKAGEILKPNVRGQLYSWSGHTQSDVGPHSARPYTQAVMEGMAHILARLAPGLDAAGRYFIPRTLPDAYEELTISGYVALMDITPNTKALLYVCRANASPADAKEMKRLITRHIDICRRQ